LQKLKNMTILFILTTLIVVVGSPLPNVLASPGAVAPDLGAAASFVALASSTLNQYRLGHFHWERGHQPRHIGHWLSSRQSHKRIDIHGWSGSSSSAD
jgi:hypothetical protein